MNDSEPTGGPPRRRAYSSAGERRICVEEWQRSGLSQAEFARRHEMPVGTLRNWIRGCPRLENATKTLGAFQEVSLEQMLGRPASWAVEIQKGDGTLVRFRADVSPAWMRQVVDSLSC